MHDPTPLSSETPAALSTWPLRFGGFLPRVLPWLLLALLYAPGTVYFEQRQLHPNPWYYIVLHYLALFGVWAAFTPLVAAVLTRWPLRWPLARPVWVAHALTALLLMVVHALLMGVFDWILPSERGNQSYSHDVLENLVFRGGLNLLLYASTAGVLTAIDMLRRYHLSERSRVQAQLDALQAQLEPHFLFNTLNALSELVYRDAKAADRVLTQLAGLLRGLMEGRAHEHRLDQELALLREYVSIQQTLLGERLQMHWDVPRELLAAQLPTLLLQPLVENAIAHGIAQRKQGGALHLQVRRNAFYLQVQLRNEGPPPRSDRRDGGIGLSNTHARLAALYGGRFVLTLQESPEGGSVLTIELPYHEQVDKAQPSVPHAEQCG